ncbi:MAG: NAD(P)-binding protein [Alkalinema sp. RL_2_19]|nr:NAD(P)-binding protein [Alkalinema sp. RL_2_19]
MAGYGAAHYLASAGIPSVMYDKNAYCGGHTASHQYDTGFTFDEGPHISFTSVERLQKMLAENVDFKYETLKARVNNYWQGHWLKHPTQCNLYGLPTNLVVNILKDFIAAQSVDPSAPNQPKIRHYADWLRAAFGNTFAETFPMAYTLKYHTTTADNMSTDWLGPRLYRPSLEEVLRGALTPHTENVHYVDNFRYPSHGGFVSYLQRFMQQTDLRLNHKLVQINPHSRTLQFANGIIAKYDQLVSSVPLPELIAMIVDAPTDVVAAAQKLACSTAIIVNLGINRPDILEAHWSYFYDQDICFVRLSTPHLQSPHNVPPGTSSLQAELYFSNKYRPLDRPPAAWIQPVIDDLIRCNILQETDEILFQNTLLIPYANVIFDLERAAALSIVHGYLDEIGIAYCGRYGEWDYIWTDESFMSGEKAAQKVCDRIQ